MNAGLKRLLTTLLVAGLASILASCSKSKDDVGIMVAANDPDMTAAIAHARSLLPGFWQTFAHPEHGETNFCLKVKITDKDLVEHFWVVDIQTNQEGIYGTINNDPDIVHNVKIGDRIKIPESDISDWLYERDRKMIGNYTVRALFKKMPAAEVDQLKQILADP